MVKFTIIFILIIFVLIVIYMLGIMVTSKSSYSVIYFLGMYICMIVLFIALGLIFIPLMGLLLYLSAVMVLLLSAFLAMGSDTDQYFEMTCMIEFFMEIINSALLLICMAIGYLIMFLNDLAKFFFIDSKVNLIPLIDAIIDISVNLNSGLTYLKNKLYYGDDEITNTVGFTIFEYTPLSVFLITIVLTLAMIAAIIITYEIFQSKSKKNDWE